MAPTSCFSGQVHRLPDAPEAYGAMITRPKAAPAQSRSADRVNTRSRGRLPKFHAWISQRWLDDLLLSLLWLIKLLFSHALLRTQPFYSGGISSKILFLVGRSIGGDA